MDRSLSFHFLQSFLWWVHVTRPHHLYVHECITTQHRSDRTTRGSDSEKKREEEEFVKVMIVLIVD
jgi:hypothetical protein